MPARVPDAVLEPYLHDLGKTPDQDVARRAGVSRAVVIAFRKRLGIAPYEGYKFGAPGRSQPPRNGTNGARVFRGRRSALDPYADLLGVVADQDVARMAGVTPENVRTYRQRRGIPTQVAARTVGSPGVASTTAAWYVEVESGGEVFRYAILAPDLATAASSVIQKARARHPGATVRTLQRIAEVLG